MNMSLYKQLTTFLLLVAVLLVPIHSFARDVTSGPWKGACACKLLLTDCATDDRGTQPGHYPDNGADDCCDSEKGCFEAAESPLACSLAAPGPVRQLFNAHSTIRPPRVVLAIFVPPES